MRLQTVKTRWAAKILRAKYFVALTDKESVIVFDGVNPESFTDVMALAAQTAELDVFYDELGTLVKRHKLAVSKLTKGTNAPTRTRKPKTTTKGKLGE